jgi:CheY-like chemotaxis protein
VLLAEDNEINQQIAIELLQSEGVEVDVVGNGAEAVSRVRRAADGAYDAVLMDLQMPELGGIEATRAIRTEAKWASLPIIAITSHAMADERQQCLDAGMQDHITKPIDPETLYRTLAAWCKRRGAARATRAPSPAAQALNIPAVDGLDAASGLRRVAGNRRLYLQLLRQYVEGQADAARQVRASLAAGDRSNAERIVHTARGVSGNIGADAVQDAAERLEQAIKAGTEGELLLARFESALGTMLAKLRAALPPLQHGASGMPAGRVDGAAVASALARLAALLRASDGEALEVVASESAALRIAFGNDFAVFEKTVNAFEFDSALERLRTVARDHDAVL